MSKTFIIYYQMKCGSFRVMQNDTNTLFTYQLLPDNIKNKFHMFKGYEASDEGLIKFMSDFKTWNNELKKNSVYNINYSYFYSHHIAVQNVFKRLCKGKFEGIQEVSEIEGIYMSKCHNGGLTYCEEYSGPCFGYDFNSYYPRTLASSIFKIPVRQGEECYTNIFKLFKSKTKLNYGMYKISITSTNPNAKKVFAFSKDDVYTHYSIEFAREHMKEFNFKFAYYPEKNGFNSYVYDDDDLAKGSDIFNKWLKTLTDLRVLFPKNKLLKHLLSSVWGTLTRSKTLNKTYEEIIEEKLDVGIDDDSHYIIQKHVIHSSSEYYVLQNNRERYYYGIARLKPFLVSYARNRTAKVAMKDIDSVLRIHTDAVCFSKEQDMSNVKNIFPEDKTTGNLKWTVINRKPEQL
jgi:hypothetical protein